MRYLCLDIETIPSPLWVPREQRTVLIPSLGGLTPVRIPIEIGPPEFPPIACHLPVVVCTRTIDSLSGAGESQAFVIPEPGGDVEAEALKYIADRGARCDRLVTFNGRGFDLPVLGLRAMVHGVDWSWWLAKRHRFPGKAEGWGPVPAHVDLLDQLGDYGAARAISLDAVAQALGLPGKTQSGASVAALWAEGRRQEIVDYCRHDVELTWAIYVRWARTVGIEHDAAIERTVNVQGEERAA